MNLLRLYPGKIGKKYLRNIRNAGVVTPPDKYFNSIFWLAIILTVVTSTLFFIFHVSGYFIPIVFLFFHIFFYTNISLKASNRIKEMESVFPEVISLMASNLRSGMTIDKAFLLAARPEFHPLDQEILKTGKDITTGQEIIFALKKMSERIESEKITRIVMLIISGLKAGGNISDLLEQTSRNMKEKELLEKKSRSTILMYVIFIFFAVGVGAPVLFGLSSVLVEVVIELTSRLPHMANTATSFPLSFNSVSISLNFVVYFAIIFMIFSDLISCMVMGLVRKGDSKEGLKYFFPLVGASLGLFFIIRALLSKFILTSIRGSF
ncbi:MAG: type II secretion system F family protein [Nanoarchaeota archaeon]